jgi:hypothetical protein
VRDALDGEVFTSPDSPVTMRPADSIANSVQQNGTCVIKGPSAVDVYSVSF